MEPGEQIASYIILRRLGVGGMGEVYLGRHQVLGRLAAIKVLRSDILAEPALVLRLMGEARTASHIEHPSITTVYDCSVLPDGRVYVVMEFLRGVSLRAITEQDLGVTSLHQLAAIVGAVADGLQAAHAQNIVHRDVKPENIFLSLPRATSSHIQVKLLDFGIAKLLEAEQSPSITKTGMMLGTPQYMSPEQCRSDRNIDHRADLYALGCVAFELFSGRPPFVTDTIPAMIVAHATEPPPPLSDVAPGLPQPLEELVEQMMAKNPDDRPADMQEVCQRLAQWLGGPPTDFDTRLAVPEAFPRVVPELDDAGPSNPLIPSVMTPITPLTPSHRPQLDWPSYQTAVAVHTPAPTTGPPNSLVVHHSLQRAPQPGHVSIRTGGVDTTLGQSTTERPTDNAKSPRPATPGHPKRHGWLWTVLGAALAIGAVALFYPPPPAEPTATPTPPQGTTQPQRPSTPAVQGQNDQHRPSDQGLVQIQITSEPANAQLWLADEPQPRGLTPLTLSLSKSREPVALTLRLSGYQPETRRIWPTADQQLTLELVARPATASTTAPSGSTLPTNSSSPKPLASTTASPPTASTSTPDSAQSEPPAAQPPGTPAAVVPKSPAATVPALTKPSASTDTSSPERPTTEPESTPAEATDGSTAAAPTPATEAAQADPSPTAPAAAAPSPAAQPAAPNPPASQPTQPKRRPLFEVVPDTVYERVPDE